jgi:hypothetical protein
MWHRLKVVLGNEPTAIGTLVASIAPALVLLGVLNIDEMGLSALVVAVNALMGFAVRLLVTPVAKKEEALPAAEIRPAEGAPA